MFEILWDLLVYGIGIALFVVLSCGLVRVLAVAFGWAAKAVNGTVSEFKKGMEDPKPQRSRRTTRS